tara:strand:+ start:5707 stop:5976 length:270 start_codon:yes stop_codon:yes gene_type:complete
MKYTKRQYGKSHSKRRKRGRYSRYKRRKHSKHKTRRKSKQIGGNNGLVQLGYNATRGMTNTISNLFNTYMGDTLSSSPQATKSQYHKSN